jgi:hypothetical protein
VDYRKKEWLLTPLTTVQLFSGGQLSELRITDGKRVTSRMNRRGCGAVTGQIDALQRLCAEQKEYNLFDPHAFDAFLLARNDIFAVYKEKNRQHHHE